MKYFILICIICNFGQFVNDCIDVVLIEIERLRERAAVATIDFMEQYVVEEGALWLAERIKCLILLLVTDQLDFRHRRRCNLPRL
ncbi:hypothetical protein C8259_29605 [Nocardia nova]|uniref:Uncharacterized protein n=1 Tax=Nocardia nova TaxID=37330 RepID=A0A2T2YT82_9NOCA|nr:hypothetical protein C8259_29605 [Nocardia nova]